MFCGPIINVSKLIKSLIWYYYFQDWIKYRQCLFLLYISAKTEIENVLDLFPPLKDKRNQKAGGLSTGAQELLAKGRALIQKPKHLLADEPLLGVSPLI